MNENDERPFGYPEGKEDMNPLDTQVGGTHYKKGNMQPIELIEGVRMVGSCSSILRYIYRHKEKNGKQDLMKVLHYADFIKKYDNWYFGCNEESLMNVFSHMKSKTDKMFYEFIKKNPQLDDNQIRVILAIQNKDIDGICKYTQKEIEEIYGTSL